MITTDCASSDSKTRDGHRRPRHDCALLFFSTSFTDEQATQGHSPYVFFSCMALVGASLLPDSSSKASMNRAIPSSRRATGWSQAPWPNTGRHTPRHVYRGDPTQTLEQSMMLCTPDGSVSKRCDDKPLRFQPQRVAPSIVARILWAPACRCSCFILTNSVNIWPRRANASRLRQVGSTPRPRPAGLPARSMAPESYPDTLCVAPRNLHSLQQSPW